jgi:hypothetical protein
MQLKRCVESGLTKGIISYGENAHEILCALSHNRKAGGTCPREGDRAHNLDAWHQGLPERKEAYL